ncbi:MAG: Arm DNA-binding domain-containing protein [Deltaproteobacteria bacterium]|nr:Arm DNA-binding domain-containing protein [Deltaproteobacteria bacterium]
MYCQKRGTHKTHDGNGLYLEVLPSGNKSWRHRSQRCGQDKVGILGQLPAVSLREARERAAKAKDLGNKGESDMTVKELCSIWRESVVVEQSGQMVGSSWRRSISGYRHIESETPELAFLWARSPWPFAFSETDKSASDPGAAASVRGGGDLVMSQLKCLARLKTAPGQTNGKWRLNSEPLATVGKGRRRIGSHGKRGQHRTPPCLSCGSLPLSL